MDDHQTMDGKLHNKMMGGKEYHWCDNHTEWTHHKLVVCMVKQYKFPTNTKLNNKHKLDDKPKEDDKKRSPKWLLSCLCMKVVTPAGTYFIVLVVYIVQPNMSSDSNPCNSIISSKKYICVYILQNPKVLFALTFGNQGHNLPHSPLLSWPYKP
jgi:hypothetical protein